MIFLRCYLAEYFSFYLILRDYHFSKGAHDIGGTAKETFRRTEIVKNFCRKVISSPEYSKDAFI